jgi:hypothetical protein
MAREDQLQGLILRRRDERFLVDDVEEGQRDGVRPFSSAALASDGSASSIDCTFATSRSRMAWRKLELGMAAARKSAKRRMFMPGMWRVASGGACASRAIRRQVMPGEVEAPLTTPRTARDPEMCRSAYGLGSRPV